MVQGIIQVENSILFVEYLRGGSGLKIDLFYFVFRMINLLGICV